MYTYKVVRIDKVVDGDTVDAVLDLGFGVSIKQRLRILGIDTPELHSRDVEQRELAQKAKAFAESWLKSSSGLIVTTYKDDKYGRMLGDFKRLEETQSFSEAMLEAGLARVYSG